MSKRRGFAAMDPSLQRELSKRGGQTAQKRGTGHRFTPEEAVSAGRKGAETANKQRRRPR